MPRQPSAAAGKKTAKKGAAPPVEEPAEDAPADEDDISSVGTPVQDDVGGDIDAAAVVDDDDAVYNEESEANVIATKAVEKPIVNIRVPDRDRITTNDMGNFTATALIAIRTKQIGQHGNALIDTGPYSTNEEVATAELLAGRCPIMVKRNVGTRDRGDHVERYWEYFRASDMVLPKAFMHMSSKLTPGKKQE